MLRVVDVVDVVGQEGAVVEPTRKVIQYCFDGIFVLEDPKK